MLFQHAKLLAVTKSMPPTYMRRRRDIIHNPPLGQKVLKQILKYITNYIHNMPCYFVSSGVEIPMTNQTFDFIWNGFGNKELTDSETSLSEENYKAISSVQKPTKPQWRKQDDGYYNRKPNDETYFQRYYIPRENETTVHMRYLRF